MVYDCAIIGTGPAGVSAALNLKIHNKNFIWLGSKNLSDKIQKAEKIMNYPGLPAVSGAEMTAVFKKQIEDMGIEITEQMVNSIMPMGESFALLAGSEFYEAKTIILTTGVANVGTMESETEFIGRGVSYCATCDGGLYRKKTIAVVCNNARFEHEVSYLAELAEKVYYYPLYKNPSSFAANVEICGGKPVKVLGEQRVTGLEMKDGSSISVDGVFCLRDAIALSSLLPDLASEDKHIRVGRQMETNIPGVYAAGDCTGSPYQYTKAVGEGNVAAHSVIKYLSIK